MVGSRRSAVGHSLWWEVSSAHSSHTHRTVPVVAPHTTHQHTTKRSSICIINYTQINALRSALNAHLVAGTASAAISKTEPVRTSSLTHKKRVSACTMQKNVHTSSVGQRRRFVLVCKNTECRRIWPAEQPLSMQTHLP